MKKRTKTIYEMTPKQLEKASIKIEELERRVNDKSLSETIRLKASCRLLDYFLSDLDPV